MPKFYVNKNRQRKGEHEVHQTGCKHMPEPENRKYLGVFASCRGAMVAAKNEYDNVDGCFYCCKNCHTK